MAAFAPANASCHFIPPDDIVETFGALLISFLIQQFLLGVIITQACTYYSRFHRRDIKLYRYHVAVILLVNFLHAGMNIHIIYRTSINHYGQRVSFDSLGWTIWAEPGVTAIGVLLAQFFFIDRCWNVIKRPWIILPLFGLLLLLPAGSGLAMSILSFKVKVWSEINKLPIPTSIWLGSMAATDTAIGVIVCASFLRARAFCCHAPTRSALTKLICLSIQTSVCTAACAAINLIVYLTLPGTLYHLLLQFSMCRVYTIMVLFTLLQRDGLRKKLDEQAIYDISLVVFDPQYNNSLKPDDASVEYI
ncbi:hypothetical protein B0H14DRAFT_3459052 [Mycena olivaceomarginata]|nr:hypothetical protein B0H14DRAFT_3459052 [Mycena olivaceomarginata]